MKEGGKTETVFWPKLILVILNGMRPTVLAPVVALFLAGCNQSGSPAPTAKPIATPTEAVFKLPYPQRSGNKLAVFNAHKPGWGAAWAFRCPHGMPRTMYGFFIAAQASDAINTNYFETVVNTSRVSGFGNRWFSHIPSRCSPTCGRGSPTIEVDVISACIWHVKVYDGRPARVFSRSQGPSIAAVHVPAQWLR